RHTRWPRDWSSDVCSSDLHAEDSAAGIGDGGGFVHRDFVEDQVSPGGARTGEIFGALEERGIVIALHAELLGEIEHMFMLDFLRSEERRVGKECRLRGAPE